MSGRDANAPDWIADLVSDLPPIITLKEAARALRRSPQTVYRMIERRRLRPLPRECDGGSSPVLFPRAEIERYLRELVNP